MLPQILKLTMGANAMAPPGRVNQIYRLLSYYTGIPEKVKSQRAEIISEEGRLPTLKVQVGQSIAEQRIELATLCALPKTL